MWLVSRGQGTSSDKHWAPGTPGRLRSPSQDTQTQQSANHPRLPPIFKRPAPVRLLENSQSWWPRRKETGGYSGGRSRQESEGDDNEDPVPLASSVVRTPTVSPEVPSPDPPLGPQGIQVWLFSSQLPNLPTAQDRPTAHRVLQMKFPHPTPVLSGTKSYCAASAQPIRQQINQPSPESSTRLPKKPHYGSLPPGVATWLQPPARYFTTLGLLPKTGIGA